MFPRGVFLHILFTQIFVYKTPCTGEQQHRGFPGFWVTQVGDVRYIEEFLHLISPEQVGDDSDVAVLFVRRHICFRLQPLHGQR